MNIWERFNETSLPDKKEFDGSLKMEDIIDPDHKHAKEVWKNFKINNLGEYDNLYVQSDTLLLVDIFKSLCNKWIEISAFHLTHFL